MNKQLLVIATSLLLIAGCTAQNAKPPAEQIPDEQLQKMEDDYNAKVESEKDEVICQKETIVGSRMKEVRCRTKSQVQYDRDSAKKFLDRQRAIPTKEL